MTPDIEKAVALLGARLHWSRAEAEALALDRLTRTLALINPPKED